LGPALLIFGAAGQPASIRFTPDTDSTDGVTAFGFEPPTVVFGASSVGFECPAFILDDSDVAPPGPLHGAPGLDPPLLAIAADAPVWRGFLARELNFYLPRDLPTFGGHAIRGYFALPFGLGGANLTVETKVPSTPGAPGQPAHLGYSVRIECLDPTARGFSGLAPTLITAALELPLDGASQSFTDKTGVGRTLTFAAGAPVRVTATLSRDPVNTPGDLKVSIGVAAQGPEGIVSVSSNGMGGADRPHRPARLRAVELDLGAARRRLLNHDSARRHAHTLGSARGPKVDAKRRYAGAATAVRAGRRALPPSRMGALGQGAFRPATGRRVRRQRRRLDQAAA